MAAEAPSTTFVESVSSASENHAVRVGGTVVNSHAICIFESIICSDYFLFHKNQYNLETSRSEKEEDFHEGCS